MPRDCLENFSYSDLHKTEPSLKRYAKSLAKTPWDTEDLVQDTLLRAIAKQHQFLGGNLQSWVIRICRNEFYSRGRAINVRKALNIQIAVGEQEQVIDESQQSDITAIVVDVRACLDKLRPEFKQILLLNGLDELTNKEISVILCIPIGTVRSRIFRAKQKLEKLLNL